MLRRLSRSFVDMSRYDSKQAATFSDKLFLVDSADKAQGLISKKDAHLNSYNYSPKALPHRAFSFFLFNANNELLLQKRSSTKITYADCWTNTCCSHQTTADNPVASKKDVITRVKAELGIDLHQLRTVPRPMEDLKFLSRFIYRDKYDEHWGEYELDYIYFLKQSDIADTSAVPYNPDEIGGLMWLRRQDAKAFVKRTDIKMTPWIKVIINKTNFLAWWEAMEEGNLDRYLNQTDIQQLTE